MRVTLTEEAVLNPSFTRELRGWRVFRISYGDPHSANPEGVLWLPPECIAQDVEDFLNILTYDYKNTSNNS